MPKTYSCTRFRHFAFGLLKSQLLYCIQSGGESKEGNIPVDSHLIGGITWLKIKITLVRRYILRVFHSICLSILTHAVRAAGKESRVCTFRMTVR